VLIRWGEGVSLRDSIGNIQTYRLLEHFMETLEVLAQSAYEEANECSISFREMHRVLEQF